MVILMRRRINLLFFVAQNVKIKAKRFMEISRQIIERGMNMINTPYDDVFRTLLNDCPKLIIPVINEIFQIGRAHV